jgi:hypothetical protein
MRGHDLDYFQNSRRATFAQREYAIHNPMQWTGYSSTIWGLTACNGPRAATPKGEPDRYANDPKTFYGYIARGAGLRGTIDDGTIAPTAAASSIAFAPEIAVPAIEALEQRYGDNVYTRYGFIDAFNPSFTFTDRPLRTGKIVPDVGWVDTLYLGIDQGPIVAMIENYRSDFVWKAMRKNAISARAQRAGFTGGWLDAGVDAANGEESQAPNWSCLTCNWPNVQPSSDVNAVRRNSATSQLLRDAGLTNPWIGCATPGAEALRRAAGLAHDQFGVDHLHLIAFGRCVFDNCGEPAEGARRDRQCARAPWSAVATKCAMGMSSKPARAISCGTRTSASQGEQTAGRHDVVRANTACGRTSVRATLPAR